MVLGGYEKYVFKPRRERDRQYWEIYDKSFDWGMKCALDECASWNRRRMAHEAQGEPFSEPFPGSKEATKLLKTSGQEQGSSRERTRLEGLKRHWVWPHLLTLFVICALIDLVALGFGIAWLISRAADIVGGTALILIITLPPLLIGIYLFIFRLFKRPWESLYRSDD